MKPYNRNFITALPNRKMTKEERQPEREDSLFRKMSYMKDKIVANIRYNIKERNEDSIQDDIEDNIEEDIQEDRGQKPKNSIYSCLRNRKL